MAQRLGGADTRLVVLRGPSGSGKSTAAKAARTAAGRGIALVEQDYLCRHLLREKEGEGLVNESLLDRVVRHCLDNGYHILLEGILWSGRYGGMLDRLHADHAGVTRAIYLDVDFDETTRRHAERPQAVEFTVEDMRAWYSGADPLGWVCETVLPQALSLDDTVGVLVQALTGARPITDRLRNADDV